MEKSSQTKQIVIGVIVVAALLVGGVMYMKKTPEGTLLAVPQAGEKSKSSLKDLLTKASPTKCTVSSTNDMSDTSGVVYIANGNMRSDFTTTMKGTAGSGKVIASHMIVDSTMSYMWGDEAGMKMGIKMARTDTLSAGQNQETPQANQFAIDMNQQSDYDCEGWTVDQSVFVPPANIEFQDMAQMMKAIPAMPTNTTNAKESGAAIPAGGIGAQSGMSAAQLAEMCGACDQAGAGRDQCRAALGCK